MRRAISLRALRTADLRCLTLGQPMATAVMEGVKGVENRPGRLWADWRLPLWVGCASGLSDWRVEDPAGLLRIWPDPAAPSSA